MRVKEFGCVSVCNLLARMIVIALLARVHGRFGANRSDRHTHLDRPVKMESSSDEEQFVMEVGIFKVILIDMSRRMA